MNTLARISIVSLLLLAALISQNAQAQKMNIGTQDLVVSKLERAISTMDKDDAAWLPSQQRLGDLLAERARSRFMLEVEANCEGCKGSKEDRQRAIKIYETLLANIKLNEHGPILFQLAHLYEMANQNDKAISLFEQIVKEAKAKKISKVIVSKSYSSLGDLYFQKGRFKDARFSFATALKDPNLDNKALATYNMAWCDFNEEKVIPAINTLEGLLRNPEKITRDTEEGSSYDPVFHADIVRDLATFYARRDITTKDIARFEVLSPAKNRKELLFHFAGEADRLGQKQAARDILTRYLEQTDLTKQERLEAFVRMAQINYDRGQAGKSTEDFSKAALAFKDTGCDDEKKCEELQKTMKRYVTELHRSKKINPDKDLLNAYIIYSQTFPSDVEMTNRGSAVAMEMKNYAVAIQLYRTISETRSFSKKERNEALLNEISAAEKSQDSKLKRSAYLQFLKYGDDKNKEFEVRYQLAYLSYQDKQFKDAALAFNELAKDKKGNAELRKKSADLSLDSLVVLKDEEAMQTWAYAYADLFPAHKNEYSALARKALMNQVASFANDKSSDKSDLKTLLKRVMNTDLKTAKADEKILFYTNQSILAQKIGDDNIYIQSIQSLLALPNLEASRRSELLEQLAAHYEKHLDFKNAYRIANLNTNSKMSEKDRQFRLGTLADLAEMNPQKHYKKALDLGIKGQRALVMRSRLVLLASNPVRELKAQAPELKRDPSLLNETALLVYARTQDKKQIKPILEMKELRRQSGAQYLKKQELFDKVLKFAGEFQNHKLNAKTDRLLQKTIKDRMKLASRADSLLAETVKAKDITAQLMMLTLMSMENERMVKDLASLPMPKGLTPAEQGQYVNLLKAQSKPYLLKAKVAQQKQQDIWNQSQALGQIANEYSMARPEIKGLLAREMQILTQLPGRGKMKSAIENAFDSSTISAKDLQSARQSVAENPLNVRDIQNLKNLETKMGHPLMPSYLEARLNQIQRGSSL